MSDQAILGLDFGGTKQAAGVVNGAGLFDDGWLRRARRLLSPGQERQTALESMLRLADAVLAEAGNPALQAVGVSFNGPVGPEGRPLRCFHQPGWEDFALAEVLQAHFGVPARVENDANAAALAEAHGGAGRGAGSVFYITVSTGIGGGFVAGGQLWRGANGLAGEIGHMTLHPDGPICTCGRRGCLEACACGPAIARLAGEALRAAPGQASRLAGHVTTLTAAMVAEAAAGGDAVALAVFNQAGADLGLAVANMISLLDPQVVVIGGGVAQAGALLLEPVRRVVRLQTLARREPASIVAAALGDEAPLWGSVVVALQAAG